MDDKDPSFMEMEDSEAHPPTTKISEAGQPDHSDKSEAERKQLEEEAPTPSAPRGVDGSGGPAISR